MEFLKTETGRILTMIVVILLAVLLSSLAKKLMNFLFIKISGKREVEPGGFYLITVAMRFVIILIGVSYAISFEPSIKSMSKSLLASAGIATAIVGFAAKDVLSNFVSGIVIILFRPFTITHWINVNNVHEGWVEEIKMLYTVIRDKRHQRMIIPNSKIVSNYVINSSYGDKFVCQYIEFNVSYNSDIKKAKKIIREIAEADPHSVDNRTAVQKKENHPIVEIRMQALGEYAIVLRALVWVSKPANASTMKWCLNEKVKEQFDQEGIEIPFPYRNLIMKNESP
jgi:small-conductance mechanosensitive channel